MTRITGPATGRATLRDTAGNDVIVAAGGGNTIISDGGSDTISAGRDGNATVLAGTAGDGRFGAVLTVRVNGLGNVITGGDADFNVVGYSGGSTVSLGNGNNDITLGGGSNTVAVGLGHNSIVAGGGGSSITLQGLDLFGEAGFSPEVTVRFGGTNNSFSNEAISGRYPLTTSVTLLGGAGNGVFDLGWGSGTVRTSGSGNVINAGLGTYDITPGTGQDTVHVHGLYQEGSDVTVRLEGSGNLVDGVVRSALISGGTGGNVVDFRAASVDGSLYHIRLDGAGNNVTVTGASKGSTVDAGTGLADVSVMFGSASLTFHGAGNHALLDGASGSIDDLSTGLQIQIRAAGNEMIRHFGVDRGGLVALQDQGFSDTGQVVRALASDGHGGTALALPTGGTLVFTEVAPERFGTANFSV